MQEFLRNPRRYKFCLRIKLNLELSTSYINNVRQSAGTKFPSLQNLQHHYMYQALAFTWPQTVLIHWQHLFMLSPRATEAAGCTQLSLISKSAAFVTVQDRSNFEVSTCRPVTGALSRRIWGTYRRYRLTARVTALVTLAFPLPSVPPTAPIISIH